MKRPLKILYAIQGTGNGHISRALEIIPHLKQRGDLDLLVSGMQYDLKIPFEIKYKLSGLYYVFGKKGGIDILETYKRMNTKQFLHDIKNLPVHKYDLVISDFEPVSSWACHKIDKPCVGLSNQVATLSELIPHPKSMDVVGKLVLKHYAPTTDNYGLHFRKVGHRIYPPIIRKQVREIGIMDRGHYTVYLPAYDDERIIKHLKRFREVKWEVFTKHNHKSYREKNVHVQPIHNELFLKSMSTSSGVLCNAGFGTASEALFLNKKLMVIPMKTQIEQQCNAASLKTMGVTVTKSLKKKHYATIENWIDKGKPLIVNYPDMTGQIVDTIIENHK